MSVALVWFRNDLRLADNPALQAALDAGHVPVPIYIHAPDEEGDWPPGVASDAWRNRSLAALAADLAGCGSRLRYFVGPSLPTLRMLVEASGAAAVFWNRRHEPFIQQRDLGIQQALRGEGVRADSFNGALLVEPTALQSRQGRPYRLFAPFWRAALADRQEPPLQRAPAALPTSPRMPDGVTLDALGLRRPGDIRKEAPGSNWSPGERGAHAMLQAFVDGGLRGYARQRDRPDLPGTSRLSAHLHFGEIAPWRIVHGLESRRGDASDEDIDCALKQLGWREFAHHLLQHFPRTATCNSNPRFDGFDWAPVASDKLTAWQQGRTGVPMVDAGMRELLATGWMHQRARMIVASYLCKHLRYHWSHGARWFWEVSFDADLASNTLGWQWTAGTGTDAAPYFRVLNPVTQAERFDPEGRYIARWVPELEAVPVPLRFAPWDDPEQSRRLARAYPREPLVDLVLGREAALQAFGKLRAAVPAPRRFPTKPEREAGKSPLEDGRAISLDARISRPKHQDST